MKRGTLKKKKKNEVKPDISTGSVIYRYRLRVFLFCGLTSVFKLYELVSGINLRYVISSKKVSKGHNEKTAKRHTKIKSTNQCYLIIEELG